MTLLQSGNHLQFGLQWRPQVRTLDGHRLHHEDHGKIFGDLCRKAKAEGKTATWFECSPYGSQRFVYLEDDLSAEEAKKAGKAHHIQTPEGDCYMEGDTDGQDASAYLAKFHDTLDDCNIEEAIETQGRDPDVIETELGPAVDLTSIFRAHANAGDAMRPLQETLYENAKPVYIAADEDTIDPPCYVPGPLKPEYLIYDENPFARR